MEPLDMRLDDRNLSAWTPFERRMALHAHCLFLCSLWIFGSLDVHNQFHALPSLEQVPRERPRALLAVTAQHHVFHPRREASLERDAFSRLAPRLPERSRNAQS